MKHQKCAPLHSLSFALLCLTLSCPVPATASDASVKRLVARAQETNSAAMLLMQDGERVTEYTDAESAARTIDLRSATKSIVALGIGLLLRDGRLDSLDTPLHQFFPEWNQGRKRLVTIRMLLNQTSGLQDEQGSPDPSIPDV